MGRVGSFFCGMAVGAATLGIAMHYHVVRGKEGVFVVPKVSNNLSDIYVDTRNFTLADWQQHRMLAVSIIRAERGDVLKDGSLDGFRSSAQEFLSGWLNHPRPGS